MEKIITTDQDKWDAGFTVGVLDAIQNMARQAREKNLKNFVRKLHRENRMTGIRLSIVTSKVLDLLARNAKVTIAE